LNEREIAPLLAQLTAGWRPDPSTNADALLAARAALAESLRAGIAPAEISKAWKDLTRIPDAATTAEVSRALETRKDFPARPLAYESSAVTTSVRNPTGTPAWARGMKVQQTLGPFLDSQGIAHWVHILQFTIAVQFAFGNAANIFAVFPEKITFLPHPATDITLGAGSVWFVANLLVPTIPVAHVCGFRIRNGKLTLSVAGQFQNNVYVLPASASATLTVTLDPPPAPASAGPVGSDAAAANIVLPASVTIVFTQNGAVVQALDNSSIGLYGSTEALTWNQAVPVAIDFNTWIVIPCTPANPTFTFASTSSSLFTPSGQAPVGATGWALAVAATPITSVAEASGAGALLLQLGVGASLQCRVHPTNQPISFWQFLLAPGEIFALVAGTGPAATTNFQLWKERPPSTRNSSIAFTSAANELISYLAIPGRETLTALGVAVAHLDRPLAADGNRFPMLGLAICQIVESTAVATVLIFAVEPLQVETKASIDLVNALIGVIGPTLFAVFGRVSGTQFTLADLLLLFNAKWLLPTLPDPYAASFGLDVVRREGETGIGTLAALLVWPGQEKVALDFAFLPSSAQSGGLLSNRLVNNQSAASSAALRSFAGFRLDEASREATVGGGFSAMLDLSTRVDQFGVAIVSDFGGRGNIAGAGTASTAPALAIEGLELAVNGGLIATFALPQISWEPMESVQSPAGPIYSIPPSDGVPLLLQAPDVQQLVPVAPAPVLTSNIKNVIAGQSFFATFSLPFGLVARIQEPNSPPSPNNPGQASFIFQGGTFRLTRPKFTPQLQGAIQLTLKPTNPDNPMALFAGNTFIGTGGLPAPYGSTVLGPEAAPIFDGEFGTGAPNPQPSNPGVPVRRADLAGYGASIWSQWDDAVSGGPHVTKVHFETVVGRTAFELIQVATRLHPYGALLVSTVTIQRQNTGWVQRVDTGWQPASQGNFVFPPALQIAGRIHRGAVGGVFNIRNIREVNEFVFCPADMTPPVFEFQKVLFDADIGIDQRIQVQQGGTPSNLLDADGNPVTLVSARDLAGYVQLAPTQQDADIQQVQQLFAQVGPLQSPFSCVVQAGALGSTPGTLLRCSAIEVDVVNQTDGTNPAPALGAALRGAPVLPRDGHWSVGRRASSDPAPASLGGDFPAPLVQALSDPKRWHVADIADVLQLGNPNNLYGLLQDTGTQRMLFEQPTIPQFDSSSPPGSTPGIQLPSPPNFADVASLLNATGLFPDLSNTVSLATGGLEQLNTLKDGLQYSKNFTFPNDRQPLTLLDIGVLRIALSYADETSRDPGTGKAGSPTQINFNLDPTAVAPAHRWSFSVAPLTFLVVVPLFGNDPMLMIIGGFEADDQTKPTLSNLKIAYGGMLSSLTNVLNRLQALAQFLPGGKGADLQVGLSDGKLTVSDTFTIPDLPLGVGDITDVSLDLGLTLQLSPLAANFTVGIGSANNPFNWIVSPLAGNGLIDIGTRDNKPEITVQGSIGLGLAIDLAIASGSASVTIGVLLDVTGSTITLMAVLTGQASVDVLDGLASASITLTAAVGFALNPFPPLPTVKVLPPEVDFPSCDITFLASVSVGIHLSICWVVSVDFDGSWQFAQTVHTPALSLGV
jgi:hypothetical protein